MLTTADNSTLEVHMTPQSSDFVKFLSMSCQWRPTGYGSACCNRHHSIGGHHRSPRSLHTVVYLQTETKSHVWRGTLIPSIFFLSLVLCFSRFSSFRNSLFTHILMFHSCTQICQLYANYIPWLLALSEMCDKPLDF